MIRDIVNWNAAYLAPAVFNPLCARLAEQAGFKVLYLGGGALGYVKTVLEANLGLTEMVQAGVEIRAACGLPLILDGTCGWGDPMHVGFTVRAAEAAGFCAIEIEDQVLPKRAHHHVGVEHMIPQEAILTDDKIATILTFVRGSFENNASPISAEFVAAIRKHYVDRKTMLTQAEMDNWKDALPAKP